MEDWIVFDVRLSKVHDNVENLGIKVDNPVGYIYKVPVLKSSIHLIMPVPDEDGIPVDDYATIYSYGYPMTVNYNVKELYKLLNIKN